MRHSYSGLRETMKNNNRNILHSRDTEAPYFGQIESDSDRDQQD